MKFYTNSFTWGNSVVHIGYNNGRKFKEKIKYKPSLFLKSDKESEYKTLQGENVSELSFETIKEYKEFINSHSNIPNFPIYNDINVEYKFLNEIYPLKLNNEGEIIPINYDESVIKIASIDIENPTESGKFPVASNEEDIIKSIAYITNTDKIMYVWGLKDYDPEKSIYKNNEFIKDIKYFKCNDEKELLLRFLFKWESDEPDIVTGWNTKLFDIPYIIERMDNVLGKDYTKRLSPAHIIMPREETLYGKSHIYYDIKGVASFDYMQLMTNRKCLQIVGKQSSYKLEYILNQFLNTGKVNYDEFKNINEFYNNDHQKFIDYNIGDTFQIFLLEEKLKLISIFINAAYLTGTNYEDIYGTTKLWDIFIFRRLWHDGIVIPPRKDEGKFKYDGGGVQEPVTGNHNWVVSFDINSLYPNIISTFNISPETIINKKYDLNELSDFIEYDSSLSDIENCVIINGVQFKKDKLGVIPSQVNYLYNTRKSIQKKMKISEKEGDDKNYRIYDNTQINYKLLMNTVYGAMGVGNFRYSKLEIADSVTATGRTINAYIAKKIEIFLNEYLKNESFKQYCVYRDTDSQYLVLEDIVKLKFPNGGNKNEICDYLDKFSQEVLIPEYDKMFKRYAEGMGCIANSLQLKREMICDHVFLKKKKHYLLSVLDKEGKRFDTPKIMAKGIKAVRSDVSVGLKLAYAAIFKMVLTGDKDGIIKYMNKFREEFMDMDVYDIAIPCGFDMMDKYESDEEDDDIYLKGCPIAAKAGLNYNHFVEKFELEHKYQKITGNRGLYVKLLKNDLKIDVIAFDNQFPDDIIHRGYIDYTSHWNLFQKSINELTTIMGFDLKDHIKINFWRNR